MSVLELDAPVATVPAGATWARVSPTLWVASERGEFIGTVEQLGDRFVGCDGHAIEVGTFADLASAKRQVVDPPRSSHAGAGPRRARDEARVAWAAACLAGAVVAGTATAVAAGFAA